MQPELICIKERLQGPDLPLLCESPEQNNSEGGVGCERRRDEEERGGDNSQTILSLLPQTNSSCVTTRSSPSTALQTSSCISLPILSPHSSLVAFLSIGPRALYFSVPLPIPPLYFFPPPSFRQSRLLCTRCTCLSFKL